MHKLCICYACINYDNMDKLDAEEDAGGACPTTINERVLV